MPEPAPPAASPAVRGRACSPTAPDPLRPISPATPRSTDGLRPPGRRSRYQRFLSPIAYLTQDELGFLTHVDHTTQEALVAVDAASGEGVGIARFIRDEANPTRQTWRSSSRIAGTARVGTLLPDRLAARARKVGVTSLRAHARGQPRRSPLVERVGRTSVGADGGMIVLVTQPREHVPATNQRCSLARAVRVDPPRAGAGAPAGGQGTRQRRHKSRTTTDPSGQFPTAGTARLRFRRTAQPDTHDYTATRCEGEVMAAAGRGPRHRRVHLGRAAVHRRLGRHPRPSWPSASAPSRRSTGCASASEKDGPGGIARPARSARPVSARAPPLSGPRHEHWPPPSDSGAAISLPASASSARPPGRRRSVRPGTTG